MIEVHVKQARRGDEWVLLPDNDMARALCRLLGRSYLTIAEAKIIADPDGLGMRVLWMPGPGSDVVREILYPVRH
jgi:hypothetical protein